MDSQKHGWFPVLAALVLGLSLIAGTLITTRTIEYVKTFNTALLTSTGTAEQVVTSDQVKWTGNFSVNADQAAMKDAYTQMDLARVTVLAFLRQNGVPEAEITFTPVAMRQNYADCKANPDACGKYGPTTYVLSQTVRVESADVPKVTALSQDAGALIRQGVFFSTAQVEYFYSKLPELRAKLLAEATKDAQQRAEQIAASTGGRIGQLVSLTTQPLQLTPVNSNSVSDAGQYDTSTIEKKLTAIVRASFRLPG